MANPREWRITAALGLAATAALGLALRLYASWSLAGEKGHILYGTDPYYHLRRAWLTLQDYPSVPYVDRFCEYPLEIKCHTWPGGFDFLLATLSLAAQGASVTVDQMIDVLVFLPPVLGALAVLATYWLARSAMGVPGALLASLVMAASPALVMQGAFGRVDHHALAPVLALLFFKACLGARTAGGWGRGRWAWLLLAGGSGGGLLASDPSGIAPVALVALVLCLDMLRAADGASWRRHWTVALASLAAVMAVGLSYFATTPCWAWPGELDFSPMSLLLLGAITLALTALGIALLMLHRRGALTRAGAMGVAAGLAAAGGAVVLLTPARQELGAWLQFLTGSLLARVTNEWWSVLSAPLSKSLGAFTPLLLALPLLVGLGLWWSWRRARAGEREIGATSAQVSLVHWSAVGALLALVQAGYFRALVVLAVALAWGVALDLASTRLSGRRRRLVLGLVAVSVAASLGWTWAGFSRLPATKVSRDQAFQVLRWLRVNSPALDPLAGSRERPAYGVMASWNLGHWINTVAERPSVSSPHLPPRVLGMLREPGCERGLCRWVRFVMAPDAAEALAVARAARSRYLVLSPMDPARLGTYRILLGQDPAPLVRKEGEVWHPLPAYWGMFYQRLMFLNGSAVRAGGRDLLAAPNFRLLAASTATWRRVGGKPVPWYKVFEVLPAPARAQGQAEPGQPVISSLVLRDGLGRKETYDQRVLADGQGRFSLSLPYATDGGTAAGRIAFSAAGPYRVRAGARCAVLRVTGAQVRAAAVLPLTWTPCGGSQRQ